MTVTQHNPKKYKKERRKGKGGGSGKDALETILLRSRSLSERCSRKTSASSRSSTAFQRVAISRILESLASMSSGARPRSPALMVYNGARMVSATVPTDVSGAEILNFK